MTSLEVFLNKEKNDLSSVKKTSSSSSSVVIEGKIASDNEEEVDLFAVSVSAKDLDNAVGRRELNDLYKEKKENRLRVYVYDMPSKFTFDLLRLFHETLKDTVNSTSNGSPIHRLIEQVNVRSSFFFYMLPLLFHLSY